MRSWLFVPGDSARKLERALSTDADVLILDLEDSVAATERSDARRTVCAFLDERRAELCDSRVFVRISGLGAQDAHQELQAIMRARPDGIVLPKSRSGADVSQLDAMLTVCEAECGLPDLSTRIVAIATESAGALFGLGSYRGASRRLTGLAWGGDYLSADLGSTATRDDAGRLTDPYRLPPGGRGVRRRARRRGGVHRRAHGRPPAPAPGDPAAGAGAPLQPFGFQWVMMPSSAGRGRSMGAPSARPMWTKPATCSVVSRPRSSSASAS